MRTRHRQVRDRSQHLDYVLLVYSNHSCSHQLQLQGVIVAVPTLLCRWTGRGVSGGWFDGGFIGLWHFKILEQTLAWNPSNPNGHRSGTAPKIANYLKGIYSRTGLAFQRGQLDFIKLTLVLSSLNMRI